MSSIVTADGAGGTSPSGQRRSSRTIDPEAAWFGLGDLDLATHLFRTGRLAAGTPLSAVTASIARRFGVEARVLPATDDRVETRIECVDQLTGERLDLHFQEYWVRREARDAVKGIRYDGALDAAPAPGVLDSIAEADVVVVCPSNPVVSIGPILAIPGVRDAVAARRTAAVGISGIVGGAPVSGMADKLMPAAGIEITAAGVAEHYRDLVCAWLLDDVDRDLVATGRVSRHPVRRRPTRSCSMTIARKRWRAPRSRCWRERAPVSIEVLPVDGLPEIRPGDDVASMLEEPLRALGARSGDVVVVTQKIVSKAEGRVVPDGDRAAWVERETERVVARRGDLTIAATRHGFVCANAGVDASNVDGGGLTLLPVDPDGSAERIRAALAGSLGIDDLGIVITDTFGRAWREGVINVAIGVAGIPALIDLRGALRPHRTRAGGDDRRARGRDRGRERSGDGQGGTRARRAGPRGRDRAGHRRGADRTSSGVPTTTCSGSRRSRRCTRVGRSGPSHPARFPTRRSRRRSAPPARRRRRTTRVRGASRC